MLGLVVARLAVPWLIMMAVLTAPAQAQLHYGPKRGKWPHLA
jgi:hypothetical protein